MNIEPPWIEDMKNCRKGIHLWILKNDSSIYCHECGIDFKKWKEETKK